MTKKIASSGKLIGERFRLTKFIRAGGQGEVWAATDQVDGNKKVAVKLFHSGGEKRGREEIEAISKIENDRVIKFLASNHVDGDSDQNELYFAMQYAKHRSLNEHDYFRNDIDLCILLFRMICEGVKAIHEAQSIHRDLKPSNILVCENQRDLKVGDLGLCLPPITTDRDKTSSRENVGPIYFTAPEQTTNPPHPSVKSDIYSLGRILHWMITGKYENRPDAEYEPVSVLLGLPEPHAIDKLIKSMVEFSPVDRPDSVEKVLEYLNTEKSSVPVLPSNLSEDQKILLAFMKSEYGSSNLRDLVEHMAIIYGASAKESKLDSILNLPKYTWKDISIRTLNSLRQMVTAEIISQSGNTFNYEEWS